MSLFATKSRCGWRVVATTGAASLLLLALLYPTPANAQETEIDVPMRRDRAAAVQTLPAAAQEGLLAATQLVRAEIELLRSEFGIDDYRARVEPHEDRTPVHVYVKALEVMSKVTVLQGRLGVPRGAVGDIPVAQVTREETMGAVSDILDAIQTIKTQMVILSEAESTATAARGRGLSAAYRNLGDASVLLDGLVGGKLTLRDVFRYVMAVRDDMGLIATKLQVALDAQVPVETTERGLVDTAQQAMRAAYKTIGLQTRLGMDASAVPTLTMVRVSPTEAYDLIGILRAELARIKWHLAINVPPGEIQDPGATANEADLFAQMLLVVHGLDQLTAAAEARR